MRKIDEIANLKFNGEIEKALEFVFKNYHMEEIIKIADELNKEECQYFLLMQEKWSQEKEKNNVQEDKGFVLNEEQLKNMPLNTTKAKIKKDILKLILVNAGILGIGALVSNLSVSNIDVEFVTKMAAFVYNGYLATDFGVNIKDYFEFKKQNKSNSIGEKRM